MNIAPLDANTDVLVTHGFTDSQCSELVYTTYSYISQCHQDSVYYAMVTYANFLIILQMGVLQTLSASTRPLFHLSNVREMDVGKIVVGGMLN